MASAHVGKSTNVRSFIRKRRRALVRDLSMRTISAGVGTLARVSPTAALDVAAYLFFRPQRMSVHARALPIVASAERLEIVRDGRMLHGWSWGDHNAPPVLLVHGWSGRAAQLTAFVEPLVASGRRVVAFDLSGHGASGGDQSTIVRLAEDLLAIDEQVGPLHSVVAHSFGGPVTMLALVAGLRAERLVFVAPPFDAHSWVGWFSRWLGFDAEMSKRLRLRLEAKVGIGFEDMSGSFLAPTLSHPLLIVHDEDDDAVDVASGERLAAHWPRAVFHKTSGLGHQRILGDPDVVASVLGFINDDNGETS